jgi:hypothetical protein
VSGLGVAPGGHERPRMATSGCWGGRPSVSTSTRWATSGMGPRRHACPFASLLHRKSVAGGGYLESPKDPAGVSTGQDSGSIE